jgi:nicotinate-nucleotide adenylyltransferase
MTNQMETPHLRITHPAPRGITPQAPGRLGVLGGAYNPITLAHLAIADAAVAEMHLHEVLFCLPQVPPHKTIFGASLEQRLDMMELAVRDRSYATVGLCSHGLFLDIERALRSQYTPETEVFFITGRDAAERILTWEYEDTERALSEMFSAFQFIVCDREGEFVMPDDPRLIPYHSRIHHFAIPDGLDHISSTALRERLEQGQPVDDLVPAAVADFIRQQGLYTA